VGDLKTVKCLVWDLDNTLWQGTLVEDGEVALAEQIRAVVVALDARGILQSVASKNDHEPAWARLEQLGLADYFVLPQISWGPKSAAVRRIADKLSFAYGTMAFVDDQATERAEVTYHLPDVRCYPASEVLSLPDRPEFQPTVTEDSRRRRQMYQAGFRRDSFRDAFAGTDEDFLRTLDLELRIGRATDTELARVEELTLRTSQMNATGVHYSDATLRGLLADPTHEVLVITMSDRFGPHGAVGVVLLERHPAVWHIKLLATSCRVVSLGAGATLLRWLLDQSARAGVHLAADFRRTDRNRMMEVAYRFAGLTDDACPCIEAGGLSGREGIEVLHVRPTPQPASTTMRVLAPELGTPVASGAHP
jgi:methoxymalonate biosynthesis protein